MYIWDLRASALNELVSFPNGSYPKDLGHPPDKSWSCSSSRTWFSTRSHCSGVEINNTLNQGISTSIGFDIGELKHHHLKPKHLNFRCLGVGKVNSYFTNMSNPTHDLFMTICWHRIPWLNKLIDHTRASCQQQQQDWTSGGTKCIMALTTWSIPNPPMTCWERVLSSRVQISLQKVHPWKLSWNLEMDL